MLYEIKGIQKHKGEPVRRWFYDDEIDLCVWLDDHGTIIGFQLVYGEPKHALTWWHHKGFAHNRVVDDGDHLPNTLVADGIFETERIEARFRAKAAEIDETVADFVHGKLLEFKLKGKNAPKVEMTGNRR